MLACSCVLTALFRECISTYWKTLRENMHSKNDLLALAVEDYFKKGQMKFYFEVLSLNGHQCVCTV